MTRKLAVRVSSILGLCLIPGASFRDVAAAPPPLDSGLFGFPGTTRQPASAVSAGFALADRWLGTEPFDNPAARQKLGVTASGVMLHVSRQDLRAAHRDFDETPAFFDFAGLSVGLTTAERFGISVYAHQPVLRQEQNAFSRGTGTPNPANPPGTIETRTTARELRAGVGFSAGLGESAGVPRAGVTTGSIGFALEWTHREDRYETNEVSGSPTAGTQELDLSGSAIGFQFGVRVDRGDPADRGLSVGLAARRLPVIPVDATYTQDLTTGLVTGTVNGEREAGWELGSSARLGLSPVFRAFASVGGSTAQQWQGFDIDAGHSWEWKLGGELHDAVDPWSLRFGLGQERQTGDATSRADVFGLGFSWLFSGASVDVGLTHRSLARTGSPNSYEDRVVLSLSGPR
jgi:hypothetical protein